ncbi:Tsi1-interacting protein TSIP1 [Zea mays]|uniref:Tsi1-interacting protein TSIP1 n=1 Tax=Zea mays TaxID=4577 RepID=A0A1D6I4K7_MAIZE|nr:Tsi1-interacting protein TSIP1 [Zea mays]
MSSRRAEAPANATFGIPLLSFEEQTGHSEKFLQTTAAFLCFQTSQSTRITTKLNPLRNILATDLLDLHHHSWKRHVEQPRPVSCSSCQSAGHVECKWCAGTGFFILGDNILCEVPSRNSKCVICSGKGFTSCADCQGTGFRAKWLEEPPIDK